MENEEPLLAWPIVPLQTDSNPIEHFLTNKLDNADGDLVVDEHKKLDIDELQADAETVEAEHRIRQESLAISAQETLIQPKDLLQTDSVDQISLESTSPTPIVMQESIPSLVAALLHKFTEPSIFYDIPPFDPVQDLVNKLYELDQRPIRNLQRMDEASLTTLSEQLTSRSKEPKKLLQNLITAQSWCSVAQVSKRWIVSMPEIALDILSSSNDPITEIIDELMLLWFIRITSLIKLRLHQLAVAELERVTLSSTSPEMMWSSYQDLTKGIGKGRKQGKVVSFELNCAAARVAFELGDVDGAIDKLWEVSAETKKYSEGQDVWQSRFIHSQCLLSTFLASKGDSRNAIRLLTALAKQYPQDDIFFALVRLYLSIGDVASAKDVLKLANDPKLTKFHDGLIDVTLGNWDSAVQKLDDKTPTAINNSALAHLYSGNVRQAISEMETLVPKLISEPILFNLTTMYDLIGGSLDKKRELLTHVASRGGDNFDVGSLKL
jgi:hypothetical protein